MIAEVATDIGWLLGHVETGHTGGAARGKKECRENAEKGALASAVGAQQRHGFARISPEGNAPKGRHRWLGKWLKKGTPATERGRE